MRYQTWGRKISSLIVFLHAKLNKSWTGKRSSVFQAFLQEQDKHLGGRGAVLRRNENLILSKKCQLQTLRSRSQNSCIAYHRKTKKITKNLKADMKAVAWFILYFLKAKALSLLSLLGLHNSEGLAFPILLRE